MQHTIESRLWDYIDGRSGAAEKIAVKKLIESEENWNRKYRELINTHQLIIDAVKLTGPSPEFLQKVMKKIAQLNDSKTN